MKTNDTPNDPWLEGHNKFGEGLARSRRHDIYRAILGLLIPKAYINPPPVHGPQPIPPRRTATISVDVRDLPALTPKALEEIQHNVQIGVWDALYRDGYVMHGAVNDDGGYVCWFPTHDAKDAINIIVKVEFRSLSIPPAPQNVAIKKGYG